MRVVICDRCNGPNDCEDRDVCVCGSYMNDHDIYCGHSPVSCHDYYGDVHLVMDWEPFIRVMLSCGWLMLIVILLTPDAYVTTLRVEFGVLLGFLALAAGGMWNKEREWRE